MPQFSTHSILAALCLAALAHADPCDPALVSDVPSLVPLSSVNAMMTWDPDRSGPLEERLVIAGDFSIANLANSNRIAAWDGAKWSTFGTGLTTAPTRLASLFGKVIAFGPDITPVKGESLGTLAQWDGASWKSVNGNFAENSVFVLRSHGDWLYIGGSFASAGTASAKNIARWNGVLWQSLGSGLNGAVNAIEVVNGEIVAGGSFTASGASPVRYVARWDGTAWRPFGNGPDGPVSSMTIHNGQLVVSFNGALMAWDGSQWNDLSFQAWNLPFIRSLNGVLFAAGFLDWGGGLDTMHSILSWDGETSSIMNGGLQQGGSSARVSCLGEFRGELYAAGQITHAGGAPAPGLARWTADGWRSIGSGWSKYTIQQFVTTPNTLYAVDFPHHIAAWHEKEWKSLPAVPDSSDASYNFFFAANGALHSISPGWSSKLMRLEAGQWHQVGPTLPFSLGVAFEFRGDIVGGALLPNADGSYTKAAVRWDGHDWSVMGSGFSPSWFVEYHSDLYAIGDFADSSTSDGRDFARWSGSAWIALDIGHSPSAQLLIYRNQILGLGGKSLFAWDGSNWTTLSAPIAGSLTSAQIFGGRLIVGGNGIGAPEVCLAQWTSTGWRPFGPMPGGGNPSSYGYVDALAVFEGTLLVGGGFDRVGSDEIYHFARISACSLCPSDLTNDAIVDDADFCNFILSYDLMDCSDPAMPEACPADFNADGLVDDTDFTRFVADYAAFLCPEAD